MIFNDRNKDHSYIALSAKYFYMYVYHSFILSVPYMWTVRLFLAFPDYKQYWTE